MSEQSYFDAPSLSNSGMSDLAVSPLRYWHLHINPERPADEPSPEMQVGSALHCAVLEPAEFDKRYACELIPPEGALRTIEEIRNWIRSKGGTPKGTRKDEVVACAYAIPGETPLILDVLVQEHAEEHEGKLILPVESFLCVAGAAAALRDEPRVNAILEAEGKAEHQIFTTDKETGVPLKGKLDWLAHGLTLDLKTFTQKRGKSIDRSVADAILYEQYYRQAYFYGLLRGWPKEFSGEFVMAFVESTPPHEVRLRVLRPKTAGNANLYWIKAQLEVRNLIRTYAECVKHFGDKPWRYAQEVEPLADEDMPGMAFAA